MTNMCKIAKRALLIGSALMVSSPLWAAEYWIDVRDPAQFQEAHLDGAINIPLPQITTRIGALAKDRNDTLHLYCNSGKKSGEAEILLQALGYKHAINEGGLKGIKK